jgi:Caspase domain
MRKVAFLVANDEFPEDDSIPRLRFPQNDANGLAEILGDKESCGFEPHVHINEPSYKVLEELYGISNQLTEDDTLLFYYSGHGMRHKNELFLVARNTKLATLVPTSIKASEVLGYVRESYCKRRILILDCCYSGVIGLGYKAADTDSSLDALGNDTGTCILTASTSVQQSEEREKDGHGLFTKALIDCLREPRKETIDIDDWYYYALDLLRISGTQNPTKCGYVEGHPIEIGNFSQRFARLRQQELDGLIAIATEKLRRYVELGIFTEEHVESVVDLLRRKDSSLFPYQRIFRTEVIRFLKGETTDFLGVFGKEYNLHPEGTREQGKDEVIPPPPHPKVDPSVTPPESLVVKPRGLRSEPKPLQHLGTVYTAVFDPRRYCVV